MSLISKKPVSIPTGVRCSLTNNEFSAQGKNGILKFIIHDDIELSISDQSIEVKKKTDVKTSKMLGTSYRIIQNILTGVHQGFIKNLEIIGVGYRANVQGSNLILQLGFSQEVVFPIPSDVTIKCEKPTSISVFGIDKQRVGEITANIRGKRPPEPYKGKGIRYESEKIILKEGKKK